MGSYGLKKRVLLLCLAFVPAAPVTAVLAKGPAGGEAGVLSPRLVMQTQDQPARDLAACPDLTIFLFDYKNYVIKKVDGNGRQLQSFGGTGTEPGQFQHLTGIRVAGDQLLAVDSAGVLTFSLDGRFINKEPFPAEVLTDHPVILKDGGFVGPQIVAGELKMVLTRRSPAGAELARLAAYGLQEYFPDLKPGEDFFLGNTHTRNYLAALSPKEDILWAASDKFEIFRFQKGASQPVLTDQYTPVPVPEEVRKKLLDRQAKVKPPLHLFVPQQYQLIYHLLAGPGGDLWIYLKSREMTGFLRFSEKGKSKGFYEVKADFEIMDAVARIFGDRMYFIAGRNIYSLRLPK